MPITVNGRSITARKGELVIAAAQRHDVYIPRFCYHERMNPVGMCRMCLVEIDTGRGPMLQPSCMVNVVPDMKVETESPASKRAQEGIIELLLANHPLDCPVCDKGGECPLQDQAFSHGPGESRYVEEKRHFEKPIPISDLVLLDRERCILCDRCTRFADEVAGDPLIHFTERGNETQVMTFPDEPFSSYFSGNTVQICPVGALTATPYRFKSRPWDLAESESTCTGCSVGCRITIQSSRDEIVRYLGVDSDPVNWGWLCDRGRFGFEATNSPDRLTTPLVSTGSSVRWIRRDVVGAAIAAVADASHHRRFGRRPADRHPRWSTRHQRGRLRVGPAGRRARRREPGRPDRRRIARRGARPAPGDHRRDDGRTDDHPPRARPEGGARGPLPAPSPVIEKRTSKLIELSPTASGLSRKAWRSIRVEAGGAAAPRRRSTTR